MTVERSTPRGVLIVAAADPAPDHLVLEFIDAPA